MRLSKNNSFRVIALVAFTVLIALTWSGETETWRKIAFTTLFVLTMLDKVIIRK